MKWRHCVLLFAFFACALALGACEKFLPAPTATPTQTAVPPTPTEGSFSVPTEARRTRDIVLSYLQEHYGSNAPAAGLSWTEERATPPGLIGAETYRYSAGDWVITISYPITAPDAVIYQVVVTNPTTGFQWLGSVDSLGSVKAPASEVADPILAARDAALAYISTHYNVQTPWAELTWARTRVTPEGLVGTETYQYHAEDWVITISFPMVAPEQVIYKVTVSNKSTNFLWQGEVMTNVVIKEATGQAGGQPVIGWYGQVIGLPAEAPFDDYLSLKPEGTGEIGLRGASPLIESEIKELRTLGVRAYFWGTLTCDVLDYGGCQLLVTRVQREDTETPPMPDAVERWEGKIVSTPTMEYEDYFVLAGNFPVRYGIAGQDPAISSQLQSLRDTETPIRIWGQLTYGVADVNGTQISVTAIEVLGPAPQPTGMVMVAEGWVGKIIALEAGSPYDDYFERDDGQRYGIKAHDAKLAAKLETLRAEGAQVRIWGQISYGISDVEERQILVTEIEAVE